MKMLNANPKKRPAARDCLMHPWFKRDQLLIRNLLMANASLCKKIDIEREEDDHGNALEDFAFDQDNTIENQVGLNDLTALQRATSCINFRNGKALDRENISSIIPKRMT
jgi:hypothetical protein